MSDPVGYLGDVCEERGPDGLQVVEEAPLVSSSTSHLSHRVRSK